MAKQLIYILGTDRQRDVNKDMTDYIPRYYHELKESVNIIDRESEEFKALNDDIKDVLDQYFIDTATWGLSHWERVCGVKTDENKPYAERRSVIKSKIRGIGTVDSILIKSVADAFTNGDVDVTEDNANYTIYIKFISKIGVPPNVEDAKQAIRDIVPAHLKPLFSFRYYTIDEVQAMTIDQINAQTMDKFSPFADIYS